MSELISTSQYVVDHFGPWRAEQIRVAFDPVEFVPPADHSELIEQTYQAEQQSARDHGFEMFNGKLARLARSSGEPDRLDLVVQPTDFKTLLATNLVLADRFAPAERADAMGVSSIIRSADSRLILGRRSQKVACNRGRIHTVGGALDWSPPSTDGASDGRWLFDQLAKELYEELTLQPEECREIRAMALLRDRRFYQPELVCITNITVRGDDLATRWRASGEYEHADLWTCHDSAEAIAGAVVSHAGEFTPVCAAAMLAYLAIQHGGAGMGALLASV